MFLNCYGLLWIWRVADFRLVFHKKQTSPNRLEPKSTVPSTYCTPWFFNNIKKKEQKILVHTTMCLILFIIYDNIQNRWHWHFRRDVSRTLSLPVYVYCVRTYVQVSFCRRCLSVRLCVYAWVWDSCEMWYICMNANQNDDELRVCVCVEKQHMQI